MFDSPDLGLKARPLASGPAPAPALDRLDADVARAAEALRRLQRPDGHWVFELEADATIPAEYLLLRHYLGEPEDLELERGIALYLRRIQSAEHGGWSLFHAGAFDISATVKAYFALKMVGDDPAAPHMARARAAVLSAGGAQAVNVFSKIQLALFGMKPPGVAKPWGDIPTMPPELILLPRWFPIHLSKMSYWARTVIAPLLVLGALKPVAKNPRGITVEELYAPTGTPPPRRATHAKPLWKAGFGLLDMVLKAVDGLWPKGLRARAICRCRAFVVERLNGEDGLGAIYPAMANSVMMFDALGYGPEHPDRAVARQSVENLLVRSPEEGGAGEIYCQPCVSPVWDTALAAHAMIEAGGEKAETSALAGLDWLKPRQVLDVKGDWAEVRPDVRPGGWAFQYANAHYPDLDDTAVVVMAMDRAKKRLGATGYDEAIARGEEWTVALQSKNGGFGAFDADNSYHYLNNIPFADHGALLDPPTEDVTGRVVSMMGQLEDADPARLARAITYLEKTQLADGSWFGRWGVNYVYGTWSVLCALNGAKVDPQSPMVRKAVAWLDAIQNADGGWGEDCDSYALDYKGYAPAPSTASQTAWAVLGLMAAGEADSDAVARGVAWLQAHQRDDGLWGQDHYTGGGFPRVFYLRYHGYPKFFPLWALARYRNLKRSNSRDVAWGDVSVLVVCGLKAEAAIARGDPGAQGVRTIVGGGRAEALRERLQAALAQERPDGVLSFGVAGALSPHLSTGDLVVASAVVHEGRAFDADPPWREALARKLKARESTLASADAVIDDKAAKSALRGATGAELVDMESGVAAELCHALGLPFCVLRAISDDARTALPPSAVAGMGPQGEVRVPAVLGALLRRPGDLPGLLRAGRDSAAAFDALRRARAELGEGFAFTA